MDHVALDRAGADDGNLDHQVIEITRLHVRQEGHLRPALDLEHADRIRDAEHVVDRRVLRRDGGQGIGLAIMAVQQGKRLADAAQHAEAEHVDLEDAERVQVVLVPFQHRPLRHGGVFDRRQFVQPAAGDDETADMLRQVAREVLQLFGQRQRHADVRFGRVEPDLAHPRLVHALAGAAMDLPGQQGHRIAGQSQRLADLAHRAA